MLRKQGFSYNSPLFILERETSFLLSSLYWTLNKWEIEDCAADCKSITGKELKSKIDSSQAAEPDVGNIKDNNNNIFLFSWFVYLFLSPRREISWVCCRMCFSSRLVRSEYSSTWISRRLVWFNIYSVNKWQLTDFIRFRISNIAHRRGQLLCFALNVAVKNGSRIL